MTHGPVYYIVFALMAYLLGSIPTGLAAVRVFGGHDPRRAGSGNIGATNVGRTSGRAAGAFTLAGDLLKGAVPVWAAFRLGPETLLVSIAGLAAFIGHLFPVWLGFRGGKGVATAFGIVLVTAPAAALLSAMVFVAAVILKRYVSLASMAAACMLPVFISFLTASRRFLPMAIVISTLVIIRHKENIRRLIAGTENRVGGGRE